MRGFNYCRPVVVIDGAHLRGAYIGTLSTLDGAGCIFPLAYGVVDTGNDCSWIWFFEQFKNAFGEREKMCVVSDRNESIMKIVRIVFEIVPHYACIWHLWKNVCGNFKRSRNTISDLFYSMAKEYRKEDFDTLMAKVDKVDDTVKEYLEDDGYEKWSRVHSTVNRDRMMTSNIEECINGCLVEALVPSSEFIFPVYEAGKRYIVCLERKECTCGRFQLDEIPCTHAIAILKDKKVTYMHHYCSDYYKPDTLAKTYEVPMSDKEEWLVPRNVLDETVWPPRYKRLAG
ncbi:uncharacterized protein [Solanum tuberosum]|uniref:uncharacterized protein n=1 Tax=Solanum tuberosum TaxID=4113 RepID=UPI00073A4DE7|nr:PREDICTED: uncharacterized protein LOC107062240 [Solanum tuberosum]